MDCSKDTDGIKWRKDIISIGDAHKREWQYATDSLMRFFFRPLDIKSHK